jgi:hypothetical protein
VNRSFVLLVFFGTLSPQLKLQALFDGKKKINKLPVISSIKLNIDDLHDIMLQSNIIVDFVKFEFIKVLLSDVMSNELMSFDPDPHITWPKMSKG